MSGLVDEGGQRYSKQILARMEEFVGRQAAAESDDELSDLLAQLELLHGEITRLEGRLAQLEPEVEGLRARVMGLRDLVAVADTEVRMVVRRRASPDATP